jgi:hypothetical protein
MAFKESQYKIDLDARLRAEKEEKKMMTNLFMDSITPRCTRPNDFLSKVKDFVGQPLITLVTTVPQRADIHQPIAARM